MCFNYWSGDQKSRQLLWYSSVPPVSWPLALHIIILPSSRGVNSDKQNRGSFYCTVFMLYIPSKLTALASCDVFVLLLKFFRFFRNIIFQVFMVVVLQIVVVFWVSAPCSVLPYVPSVSTWTTSYTPTMEARCPSKMSDQRKHYTM
jgi:hypothetical protein